MFTVDQAFNRRNDRVVVPKDEEAPPVMTTKHPAGVMVLGVVGSDGQKMPPHFFPCGLKINTEEYLKVLRRVVLPWIKATYPGQDVVWQQDSAPAHGANKTQKWQKTNMPKFWAKEVWPSSSPDLNPLDYAVWGELERHACATPHPSVEALKASILEAWANMSSNFVVKSCRIFRRRVEAVIKAEGGHIEKKMTQDMEL
ncbi:Putative transposable element [Caligus rogercresseyi]|uniref:Transposable element n=1 Tax=Caligus rogercresseyi TaxID=217165 RepID=A0A7T8QST4_CALRO|nr:Putative transposable element [Caligus rogercresseyi]